MGRSRRKERRQEARARREAFGLAEPAVLKARRFVGCPVVASFASRETALIQKGVLAIVRERADGMFAGMSCVVDRGALGVKDVDVVARGTLAEVSAAVSAPIPGSVAPWSDAQVVRTLRQAAAWREHCGLPQRVEERVALAFCTGLEEDADHEVPLGMEGKPFFSPGPYDDAEALEALLIERWGPDGYHYLGPG